MQEIRIHGRGGQGAVTGAYLLGHSAFVEDMYAQAFPNFGVERTGAPLEAYARLSRTEIRLREQIDNPDYLIIQDPTLASLPATFAGTDASTIAVINSPGELDEKIAFEGTLYAVDATKLAVEVLGRPIFNTAMLGYFLGITKLVKLESLVKAVKTVFPKKLHEPNIKLVKTAYENAPSEPIQYSKKALTKKKEKVEKIKYSVKAGSTTKNKTGTWRLNDPIVNTEACIQCGACTRICPENCILKCTKGVAPDLDFCKGCGLCASVCPVKAIRMDKLGTGSSKCKK